MADFFRFLRDSNLNSSKESQMNDNSITKNDINNPFESHSLSSKSVHSSSPKKILEKNCVHITKDKWEELWTNCIKEKADNCKGLVFVNPNFARNYFVPSIPFKCEFDNFNEYSQMNLELLEHIRNNQYDKWMKAVIQSSSCHISIHCCNVIEILKNYCLRCPNLTRISFHYYQLDDQAIEYLSENFPKIISINLENSIGLTLNSCITLKNLSNLLHLNLSGCDLKENSLNAIFANCSQLESINISNNNLITGQCLTHKNVKNLRRLNIQDCWRIKPEIIIDMVQCGLPNLIELLCNSGINDESLKAITFHCANLLHLDISFEDFTYYDKVGLISITDSGFMSIGQLNNLKILCLRHVGRITDEALNEITGSCTNLIKLTLNLRHRHKLTDGKALNNLSINCTKLLYFEAVHNHFIGQNSIEQLSRLTNNLEVLMLRGNELIKDDDISLLIQRCLNLRFINLDGCPNIGENTLANCVVRARKLLNDSNGSKLFRASLVMTSIERSLINSLSKEFPVNFRVRACDYRFNKVHYNEFDGADIHEYSLKEKFFPYYWYDYN